MTRWEIDLQNLRTVPVDTRPACVVCGAHFDPKPYKSTCGSEECRNVRRKLAQKKYRGGFGKVSGAGTASAGLPG